MKCPYCSGVGIATSVSRPGFAQTFANVQTAQHVTRYTRTGHPLAALVMLGVWVGVTALRHVLTTRYRCQACGRAF